MTSDELDQIMTDVSFKRSGNVDFEEFKNMMLAENSPMSTPYPKPFDTLANALMEAMPMQEIEDEEKII